jgi:shikimate dehydrogenase
MTQDRDIEDVDDPPPGRPGNRVAPGRAAVLGHPISHSLSPVLHRAAYDSLGLTGWEYGLIDVDETGLSSVMERLGAERSSGRVNWVGLSLTMPLKRAIVPLLGSCSDLASAVGAVNTVIFTADGPVGDNTDVAGMIRALEEAGVDRIRTAAVLGGGATATSAVAAVRRWGCRSVTVHARRFAATAPLREAADRLGMRIQVRGLDREELEASVGAEAVISTLPPVAADGLAATVAEVFRAPVGAPSPPPLLDVVYAPWPTVLAGHWSRVGGKTVGGLAMLVHQAAEQVRLMTGRIPPVEVMRRAGQGELARGALHPGE